MLSSTAGAGSCIRTLYVMGFTGGVDDSSSDSGARVKINLQSQARTISIPDNPNVDDQTFRKGDLWTMRLANFGFSKKCIRQSDIKKVTLFSDGKDGWYIDTIVIMVKRYDNSYRLLTGDMDMEHWLDSNRNPDDREIVLSILH